MFSVVAQAAIDNGDRRIGGRGEERCKIRMHNCMCITNYRKIIKFKALNFDYASLILSH